MNMPNIIGYENALRTTGTIVAFHEGSVGHNEVGENALSSARPRIEVEFTDFEGALAVGYAGQTKEHSPATMRVSQEVEIEYWDVSEDKKAAMGAATSVVTAMMGGMLKLFGQRNVSERFVERATEGNGRRHYQVRIVG